MRFLGSLIVLLVLFFTACGGSGGGGDVSNSGGDLMTSDESGGTAETSTETTTETTGGETSQVTSSAALRTCGLEDAPLRIMPLGDSITESESGYSSYRFPLWQALLAVPCSVDFVGSRNGVSTGDRDSAQVSPAQTNFDQDHEGHWDYRADEILNSIDSWASAAQPDIVLIHLGTNDTRQQDNPLGVVDDIGRIIDRLRVVNPGVSIVIAQIIPSRNDSFRLVNDAIPALAEAKDTAQSRVIVANHSVGYDPRSDSYDGVHPGPSGEAKMAEVWLNAILELVGSAQ